jgi:hypothetical protein
VAAMPSSIPNLRPLTVGEILDASFKVYRRSFVTMAKAILIVAVPFAIINAPIRTALAHTSLNTIDPYTGQTEVNSSALGRYFGLTVLSLVITLVASAIATAVIYRVVGSVYLGNKLPSWTEAIREGLSKAHSVLWVTVLNILILVAAFAVPFGIVRVLDGSNVNGLGALFGILTGIPAGLFVIWYWVVWQLSVPTVMLENYKGRRAIGRAGHLVRHLWWRSFGCILLISLIVGILTAIV